jgi:ABC-type multidrug transport system fused ATPase/permease subunit
VVRVHSCVTYLSVKLISPVEFASPLLLQQLLLCLESPVVQKGAAFMYALLLWGARAISAQTAMLAMWYGRRCYERTRGEMIAMVYEKALLRKAPVGLEKQSNPGGSDEHSHNRSGNGSLNNTKSSRAEIYKLFKVLFSKSTKLDSKLKGPMSTGKILNIIRGDVYEISQRFWEIETLVKTPFGLVFAIYLIWKLLGPSCFFAVLVVVVAQVLNATITRVQVRWRRYKKEATDARLQVNSQYIEVLRHLRWYGWEHTWLQQVIDARRHELNIRVVQLFLNILVYFINVTTLSLFPVAAFFAYTYLAGHSLRIDIIFPALQLFNTLQSRLREIPGLINTWLNAYVAMARIEEFMSEPEQDTVSRPPSNISLKLHDCSFAWPGMSTPVLRDVSLVMDPGLTVIYGKVGAGKTALLQALLGELDQLNGVSEIPNEMIGYFSQTPWLQSMSIRDNILFFSPYQEQRYQKVLDTCALLPDLTNFNHGDHSLIGENGIGLSGGQKARVALARAIYSRSKILLLDDPLSALDHNTAEIVVQKCFSGPLMQDRIVVLVTHRTSLVRHLTNRFVEVSDGQVFLGDPFSCNDGPISVNQLSDSGATESELGSQKGLKNENSPDKFVEDEHREHGGVKAKVWLTYIKAGKLKYWAVLIIMIALTRILNVVQTWVFKAWGEAYNKSNLRLGMLLQTRDQRQAELISFRQSHRAKTSSFLNPIDYLPPPSENVQPWILLLLAISIGQSLALLIYATAHLGATYNASKTLFSEAIVRVTNATFRFYDVTPTGRLMNRLTSDIEVIDTTLHYLGLVIFSGSLWAVSVIAIASVTPLFLIFSATLMGLFVVIFLQYLPASQSLKRLETVSLSPLFANFGELLQGLTTIRAFHVQQLFQERIITILDNFQGVDHFYWSIQNWLMYRYENLSALSTFALTAVALSIDLSPGLTAFMLVNAAMFIDSTHDLCKRYGELQMKFVSAERVVELLEIEQEPAGTFQPPASWPKVNSDITFENVTVRYAPHLSPSLVNISLHIPGGSTAVIIGRTGSGKSTLAASLLKIVQAESGIITIDNVALTNIDVKILRQRVTFVPQDPILFDGTIRHNLDPIREHSDHDCKAALERICARQGWTLQTRVESGGRNLSLGQRQLIGITRAILRQSPIVILDEATASIDFNTSMEIQQILRNELKESTVVIITHRVEAVKDADYFIELENGKVLRQGSLKDMLSQGS